jgi:4a-hydroxytetrahydrobiopterin dehydratase
MHESIVDLTSQKCAPCEGGAAPLTKKEAVLLLRDVPGWTLATGGKSIRREYTLKNFREALTYVHHIGELAEAEGHHPDVHLTAYRHLTLELSTHAIGGLSQNDFILAAKINACLNNVETRSQ